MGEQFTIHMADHGRPLGDYVCTDKKHYLTIQGTCNPAADEVLAHMIATRVAAQMEESRFVYDDFDLVMETRHAGNRVDLGVMLPTVVFRLHFLKREQYTFTPINDQGRQHFKKMIQRWKLIRLTYEKAQIDKMGRENS